MNISDIITKCYILALIIRDDGERLLLGDGFYEFKEQLQHFQPNTFQNDVIELQGTDGQLLAGQVRRGATQSFDGYIADSTISREATEEHRQRFLAFFRKKHHYKVVYVFPDGSAIKRERGYIVDAPSVPEMFQRFPEFHVGLNFEDVNYYEYEEGEDGEEIFAHIQNIAIAGYVEGGLIWDNYGAVSNEITWVDYALKTTTDGYAQITDGVLGAPLNLEQLYGNATQKTLSGKNLASLETSSSITIGGLSWQLVDGEIHVNGTATGGGNFYFDSFQTQSGTATLWIEVTGYTDATSGDNTAFILQESTDGSTWATTTNGNINWRSTATHQRTVTLDSSKYYRIRLFVASGNTYTNATAKIQLEYGSTATAYEPYVGGTASPNPDYPQDIQVVTGEQTVKITGKNLVDYLEATYADNGADATKGSHSVTFTKTSDGQYRYAIWKLSLADSQSLLGKTASLSFNKSSTVSGANSGVRIFWCAKSGVSVGDAIVSSAQGLSTTDGEKAITFDIPSTAPDSSKPIIALLFYPDQTNAPVASSSVMTISDLMLELGSQATDYEPYQGQSYTLSLGTLELAKIGTYQDYIWNDDGTWYKHKEVGKVVLDGTEDGWDITGGGNGYRLATPDIILTPSGELAPIMSDYYTTTTFSRIYNANIDYGISNHNNNHWLAFRNKDITSLANFKTWLGTHNTTVYYALATPTDTEITDQTLIQELSTIKALVGETDNIWLIPSSGAQGEMEVRYSRGFINQGAGYEWDAAQGGGPNILSVDGIDRTGFVWEVVGPATNPTLTNITTNQTMTFEGDVATGQTLTVNTSDQTAEIAGTNVFAQMEGDWMQLAPGNNVITYTATGATEPSKIKWNGVVG